MDVHSEWTVCEGTEGKGCDIDQTVDVHSEWTVCEGTDGKGPDMVTLIRLWMSTVNGLSVREQMVKVLTQ